MPVSIIANQSSQYAQASISNRSDAVTRSTLQISTGNRVFDTVEDSAALAVGAGLRIDNAALASARINASAGISMLQIADGALGSAAEILVRMQTLAVQASSGNLSNNDRAPIDLEFQSLKDELDRLAGSTEFNGVSLLDGQPSYTITNASSYTADGVTGVTFNSSGLSGDPVVRYSYDATTEQMTLERIDGGTADSQVLDLTAILNATAGADNNLSNGQTLQLNFNDIGITLTLGTSFDRTVDIEAEITDSSGADIAVTTPAFVPATTGFDVDGVDGLLALAGGYNATTGDLTIPLNTNSTIVTLGPLAGLSFDVDGGGVGASGAASADMVGAAGYVDVYVDTAGTAQRVGRITYSAIATTGNTDGSLVINAGKGMFGAELQTSNTNTILNYKVGTGVVNGQDILTVTLPPVNTTSLSLTSNTVTGELTANASIDALALALQTVSSARATVGAQQSRLNQLIGYIDVFKENNEVARSTLIDVNVPQAISELANNQAMLEAGIAMLSQSNRIPDMLLNMLRNS